MSELRRTLLDEGDPPAELGPELRFLGSRDPALAALVLDHAELYRVLIARYRAEGPSPDIQAIALDAAGNLGALLQSIRSREELLAVLAHLPGHAAPPLFVIDQLFFSFLLLSGPCSEDDELVLLSPDGLDGQLSAKRVRRWLAGWGKGAGKHPAAP